MSTSAVAQDEAAADQAGSAHSETGYLDLRRSEDRTTQMIAERYFGLVKLQEWSDLTGKFDTTASYVAHDPEMKWVKLQVVKGRGADRVSKDVTVPLDRLSKACQSRVRQIATLQAKLDELAAAAATDGESDSPQDAGARQATAGQPMRNESGARPATDSGRDRTTAEPIERRSPYAPSQVTREPAATGTREDDPLGFAELEAIPQPGGGTLRISFGPGGGPVSPGSPRGSVDRSQWATSYPAFLANLGVTQNARGEPQLDYGELAPLVGTGESAETAGATRVVDVIWEAPFQGIRDVEGGTMVLFDLPPTPLDLQFRVDQADRAGSAAWSQFSSGDRLRFHGRLRFSDPTTVVVDVREPEPLPAEPREP